MHHHQRQQDNGHGDNVKRKEAVQGGIRNHIVTTNPQRQGLPDTGNGAKQRDDHLCAPVRHLPPGQQIAHKGLGHQSHIDHHAKDPDQLPGFLEGAVDQTTEHVQINDDKEE